MSVATASRHQEDVSNLRVKEENEFLMETEEADCEVNLTFNQKPRGNDEIKQQQKMEYNIEQLSIDALVDGYNTQLSKLQSSSSQWNNKLKKSQRESNYQQPITKSQQSKVLAVPNPQQKQVESLPGALLGSKTSNDQLEDSNKQANQVNNEEDYEFCPNCARKFFSGRLTLHLKSCKHDKPLKPAKKPSTKQLYSLNQEPHLDIEGLNDTDHISQQQTSLSTGLNHPILPPKQKPHALQISSISLNQQEIQQQEQQTESKNSNTNSRSEKKIEQLEQKISFDQPEQVQDDRVECMVCGRKFINERIQKHEAACAKSNKTRQVYNSAAARAPEDQNKNKLSEKSLFIQQKQLQKKLETKTGEEVKASNRVKVLNATASQLQQSLVMKEGAAKKVPKWKLEHEQLISNIKYNKLVNQAKKKGEDVSKIERPLDDLDALGYIHCQHCLRKFAKETALRHIPLCKNIINRPKPPRQPSGQETAPLQEAKNSSRKQLAQRDEASETSKSITSQTCGDTNDTSDQASMFSSKTLNSTGIAYIQQVKQQSKRALSKGGFLEENHKSRTGLLPEIKGKDLIDQKFLTTRKFGNYNTTKIGGFLAGQSTLGSTGTTATAPAKSYDDIYSRTMVNRQVQCPHCERSFVQSAADRHIPICKNLANRPNLFSERTTRMSLPKKLKISSATIDLKQFRTTTLIQHASPRPQALIGISERSASDVKLQQQQPSRTKVTNFCGFCGFQFAMDHKYCGSCGKKRFNTTAFSNGTQSSASTSVSVMNSTSTQINSSLQE